MHMRVCLRVFACTHIGYVRSTQLSHSHMEQDRHALKDICARAHTHTHSYTLEHILAQKTLHWMDKSEGIAPSQLTVLLCAPSPPRFAW